MKFISILFLLCLDVVCLAAHDKDYSLTSLDGKMVVSVKVGEGISWSLSHGDDALIADSPVPILF